MGTTQTRAVAYAMAVLERSANPLLHQIQDTDCGTATAAIFLSAENYLSDSSSSLLLIINDNVCKLSLR